MIEELANVDTDAGDTIHKTWRYCKELFLLLSLFVLESDAAMCLDAEIRKIIFASEPVAIAGVMTRTHGLW